ALLQAGASEDSSPGHPPNLVRWPITQMARSQNDSSPFIRKKPDMPRRNFLSCLIVFFSLISLARGDEAMQADEQALQAVGLRSDGPVLLEFFQKRTAADVKPERLAELVRQLGDKSAPVREKATGELVSLGTIAVPWLRQAAKDPDDLETANRAR